RQRQLVPGLPRLLAEEGERRPVPLALAVGAEAPPAAVEPSSAVRWSAGGRSSARQATTASPSGRSRARLLRVEVESSAAIAGYGAGQAGGCSAAAIAGSWACPASSMARPTITAAGRREDRARSSRGSWSNRGGGSTPAAVYHVSAAEPGEGHRARGRSSRL